MDDEEATRIKEMIVEVGKVVRRLSHEQVHIWATTAMAEIYRREGSDAVLYKMATLLACMHEDGHDLSKLLASLKEKTEEAISVVDAARTAKRDDTTKH